jgi:hypothetical protein
MSTAMCISWCVTHRIFHENTNKKLRSHKTKSRGWQNWIQMENGGWRGIYKFLISKYQLQIRQPYCLTNQLTLKYLRKFNKANTKGQTLQRVVIIIITIIIINSLFNDGFSVSQTK